MSETTTDMEMANPKNCSYVNLCIRPVEKFLPIHYGVIVSSSKSRKIAKIYNICENALLFELSTAVSHVLMIGSFFP